jgi:hypothetical protein
MVCHYTQEVYSVQLHNGNMWCAVQVHKGSTWCAITHRQYTVCNYTTKVYGV